MTPKKRSSTLETILVSVLASGVLFLPRTVNDSVNKPNLLPTVVTAPPLEDDFINISGYEVDKHEFYRRKARNLIIKLAREHKVWPPGVVVSDEKRNGYYDPGKIKVSLSLDLFTGELNDWYFAAVHEFGHHKYRIKADKDRVTALYYEANIAKITSTFKEGLFDNIPVDFGHPVDLPTELYASAFVISECKLIDAYKKKFFPLFSEEHKRLAELIFEEVGK
jgi:hypothetical protein